MSEKLSWVFELLDRVSNPAKAMDKALGGVEDKLKHADDKMNAAGGSTTKLGLAHRDAGEHVHGFFEKMRHGLETVYFGKEVIGSLIEKVREIGGEIVAGVGFKQRSMLGLTAMLGDKEKAREYFEDVEGFAGKMGLAVRDVMEQTKSLLSAGFDKGEIDVIRRGVADLSVVSAEKAAVLSEQIADIGRNGMMTSRQLLALRHVLPMKELREELGVTADGMNKLLDGSKAIEAGKAISGILKVVRDRYSGGFLGKLAEQDAKTLPKLIDRVKMLPELIMSAVAGFEGQGTAPFEHILENISETFNPEGPSGKRIVTRVRELVEMLGRAFGIEGGKGGLFATLAGEGGPAKLEEIFNRVATAVESAIPKLKAAAGAVWSMVEALAWMNDHADTKKIGHAIITSLPGVYDTSTPEGRAQFDKAQAEQDTAEARTRAKTAFFRTGRAIDPQTGRGFGFDAPAAQSVEIHGDIHFHNVKDADQAGDDFGRWLADHMERVAFQKGG